MIPLLGISQNGYPKTIKIGNDTIVAFTPEQARKLDSYRIDLIKSKEKVDYFKDKSKDCDDLYKKYSNYVKEVNVENNLRKNLDSINSIQLKKTQDDLAKSEKKVENKNGLIKILGTGFVTVSLTLIGVLVF